MGWNFTIQLNGDLVPMQLSLIEELNERLRRHRQKCVHVSPCWGSPWYQLDVYDRKGMWEFSSRHETKQEAQHEARRHRRRWRYSELRKWMKEQKIKRDSSRVPIDPSKIVPLHGGGK